MTRRAAGRRSQSGIRLPLWGLGLLGLLVLLFVLASSVWLFRTIQGVASDWEATDPDFGVVSEPAPQTGPSSAGLSSARPPSTEPIISVDALKPWSGRERVTILVLGIDQRCDDEGPTRTDTMMVMTMDPVGLSAAVLSLPRDLWVEIPGFGVDKINQAHFLGEIYEYPGGGAALATETVEAALGVAVDFYATIDFVAFVEIVDQIGGIELDVAEEIRDELYPDSCYGYDPFFLDSGRQHLDGQTALKYARTRATFGGDVDRANRQQEVLLALRDKILQLNMAPQLITRAPELWRILQDNVRTNLSLNEVIQLAMIAKDIPSSSVRTEVIDFDYVYNETTPDGQQVLVPVRDKIRVLRDQLFLPPAIPTPVIENLPLKIGEEDARIAVYNGTRVFGLAAATEEFLVEHDINVVEIGNADSADYRTSQVIDYGSHPSTTLFLTQLMDIPPLNISTGSRPEGDYDVLVILGSDWEVPVAE